MLLGISVVHSFLLLSSSLIQMVHSLSVHLLMDVYVISKFLLL